MCGISERAGRVGVVVWVLGATACDRRLAERIVALEPKYAIDWDTSGYLYPVASDPRESFHIWVSLSPDTLSASPPVSLGSIHGSPGVQVVKGELEDYRCAGGGVQYKGWSGTISAEADARGASVHLVVEDLVLVDIDTWVDAEQGGAPLPSDATTYTIPRLEWDFPIVSLRGLFDCPTDFG